MTGPTLDECYRILGLTSDATPEQVTHAFRRLILQRHPDRNPSADPDLCDQTVRAYHHLRQHANRRPSLPPIQPHELATAFCELAARGRIPGKPEVPRGFRGSSGGRFGPTEFHHGVLASKTTLRRRTESRPVPAEKKGRTGEIVAFAFQVAAVFIMAGLIAVLLNSC